MDSFNSLYMCTTWKHVCEWLCTSMCMWDRGVYVCVPMHVQSNFIHVLLIIVLMQINIEFSKEAGYIHTHTHIYSVYESIIVWRTLPSKTHKRLAVVSHEFIWNFSACGARACDCIGHSVSEQVMAWVLLLLVVFRRLRHIHVHS